MPSRLASTICGPPASGLPGTAAVFPDPHRARYLARFTGADDDSLLFTSPTGSAADSNFRRRAWPPALAGAGLADLHFHDLRHAGHVLAAAAGANLRELMERMGHRTTRAAIVYPHSTDERQRKVADALGGLARAELRDGKKRGTARGASGPDQARNTHGSGGRRWSVANLVFGQLGSSPCSPMRP